MAKTAPKQGSFADRRRGSRHERGYGSAWVKVRKQVLTRDAGLCQPCLAAGRVTNASAVDHVVNKESGGTEEMSNLQSICQPCHDIKTMGEHGGRARQPTALDGRPTDPAHPWNRGGGEVKSPDGSPLGTDRLPLFAHPRNS